jgi:hypothetical protein
VLAIEKHGARNLDSIQISGAKLSLPLPFQNGYIGNEVSIVVILLGGSLFEKL